MLYIEGKPVEVNGKFVLFYKFRMSYTQFESSHSFF